MTRQLDVTKRHVYDSEHDEWVGPFDDEESAHAYAQEVISPIQYPHVFNDASPAISAYNYFISTGSQATTSYEIVAFNPSRVSVRLKYIGPGQCLIGTKEAVSAGQGYAITSVSERFQSTASIWASVGPSGTTGFIHVFSEEISAPS